MFSIARDVGVHFATVTSPVALGFYRAMPVSVYVCLSVCLSVTSRCSIETAERIELVFGM